jgi:hypothetical protein
MELEDVKAVVEDAFHRFLTTWLPKGIGDAACADGAILGRLSNTSMDPGVHWMLNCGLGNDSLAAQDVDNLIQWWERLGNGRTAARPAKSDSTGHIEVHLFGVKYQNESSGALTKYKFNYHVPVSGRVGVQLKSNQQRDLRSGRRKVGDMGLKYAVKNSNTTS